MSRQAEVLSTCRSLPSGPTPTTSPEIVDGETLLKDPRSPGGVVLAESQPAEPASASDRMTQAALAFFEAKDDAAIKAAFSHLLKLVFRARRNLFLTERGRTQLEATHEFLEMWLLQRLLPCRNAGTVYEAAQRGEFRYLGKQGRNALIDELRRRDRSKDPLDRMVVRMDSPIGSDDGDAHSWHNLIGVDCPQNAVCPIGTKPSVEPAALQQKVQQSRPEIAKTLGEELFDVLSIVCDLFPDRLSLGEVTRGIAKARAVTEQTARKLHHALARKLVSLRGDPVVRGLVEIIRSAGDPIHLSTGAWDPQSQGFTPN